jgi:hypothetical protein
MSGALLARSFLDFEQLKISGRRVGQSLPCALHRLECLALSGVGRLSSSGSGGASNQFLDRFGRSDVSGSENTSSRPENVVQISDAEAARLAAPARSDPAARAELAALAELAARLGPSAARSDHPLRTPAEVTRLTPRVSNLQPDTLASSPSPNKPSPSPDALASEKALDELEKWVDEMNRAAPALGLARASRSPITNIKPSR